MKKRVWLKQLRTSRGLTQDTVASRAFIDRSFYAQIENGTRDPSMTVAVQVANVLGISPELFFIDHLQQFENSDTKPQVVFAHSDLNLRYTWVWHPHFAVDEYIGKRDDEIWHHEGAHELLYLKKQVILQGVALEKVVVVSCRQQPTPCLVRAKPLLDDDDRICGVATELAIIPSLVSRQSFPSNEPRGILEGHIIYCFESLDSYKDNLTRYILDGLDYGYHVWVFEQVDIFHAIEKRLAMNLTQNQFQLLHYVDSEHIRYQTVEPVTTDYVSDLFERIMAHGVPIRIWRHVVLRQNELCPCGVWETLMDEQISQRGITSVCAYDGNILSASSQNALLRTHGYLMTDTDLVNSPLYPGERTSIFPTLAQASSATNNTQND